MSRMTKHLSFKKHEKDLYDYICDESKIHDSSAFIKDLIRKHMEQEKNIVKEEPVKTTSTEDFMKDMFNEFKNTMSQVLEQNNKMLEKQLSNIKIVASAPVVDESETNTTEELDPNIIHTSVGEVDEENKKLYEDFEL